MNGYYNLSDKIGEKFYESENTVIKNVREYSLAFTKSINKGEEEGRNPEKKEEVVVESHEELRWLVENVIIYQYIMFFWKARPSKGFSALANSLKTILNNDKITNFLVLGFYQVRTSSSFIFKK